MLYTENVAETLLLVLKRISEVMRYEFVNERVIVSDRSTEASRKLVTSLGWYVVLNKGKNITDGGNAALKCVM